MKEKYGKITYKNQEYIMPFNFNVMQAIQEEYGTLEKWGNLSDGIDEDGNLREVDAKAVIFGAKEMLNEGIDIMNEENGTDLKPFTLKQAGRLVTELGMEEILGTINETVIESTKDDELKN